MAKDRVLFVGSFKPAAKDGSVGGQMFASRTLVNSKLKDQFNFVLIDSTSDSVPAPAVYKRIFKVIVRLWKLIIYIIIHRPTKVLLFSSSGLSLLEKGLMVIISKILFRKVIFAPRSGLIKDDVARSGFYKKYLRLILSLSDYVICQGSSWKNFYAKILLKNTTKLIVIQNWIDTNVYISNNPIYKNQKSFAKELIYIGWIEEYKGIFDLIEAIALIKGDIDGLCVSIYGNGSKLNEAKKLCLSLGLETIIQFKGWADSKIKLQALANADIYVLPSHTEGFPNSLIEAMASGLPTIATNVGGISDLITNNNTGLLIEPKCKKKLAEAIHSLYSDPKLREKLSNGGRNQVLKNNSLDAMYENLSGLLKK